MSEWNKWYAQGFRAGRLDASIGIHSEKYPYSTPTDDPYHIAWSKGYNDGQRDYQKEEEMRW